MKTTFNKSPIHCQYLGHHLAASADGRIRPCCRFKSVPELDLPRLSEMSFKEAFHHPVLEKTREELKRGHFPESCRVCREEEEHGVRQYRMNLDKECGPLASERRLQAIEIFVGSLCNMKCRMCNEEASSKWAEELGRASQIQVDLTRLFDGLNLKEIRLVRFVGGETLINPKFFEVIETLKTYAEPSQVILSLATNGSVALSEKLLNAFDGFRRVDMDFSVDGIGSVGEYIRHGVPWNRVENVILQWMKKAPPHFRFNVHTTLQAANYASIDEIILFCMNLPFRKWSCRLLNSPEEYSVRNLPMSFRRTVADRLLSHPKRTEMVAFLGSISRQGVWRLLTDGIPAMPEGEWSAFTQALEHYDKKWNVNWRESLSLQELS